MQSLWPFSRGVLDLIGQLSSISLGGHKFIIISTKYFTKWVEAMPIISKKEPKIAKFIENHIIYHFGIPAQIIIVNGKNFKNKEVLALYKVYHIQISLSMPYYPQGNGKDETMNKTICSILLKIVNNSHKD